MSGAAVSKRTRTSAPPRPPIGPPPRVPLKQLYQTSRICELSSVAGGQSCACAWGHVMVYIGDGVEPHTRAHDNTVEQPHAHESQYPYRTACSMLTNADQCAGQKRKAHHIHNAFMHTAFLYYGIILRCMMYN